MIVFGNGGGDKDDDIEDSHDDDCLMKIVMMVKFDCAGRGHAIEGWKRTES